MHSIEPHYNWRHLYIAEDDPKSPFYNREYSEFDFTNQIYNHLIHPQWDDFGSNTLYIKIIYADYDMGAAFIELLGEWNDCLYNDIMFLKRDVIESLMRHGIHKFVIIGENVLNFHYSDDSYYEEWFEEVVSEEGWIVFLNFSEHVLNEFKAVGIDQYFLSGNGLENIEWRTQKPDKIVLALDSFVQRKLGL
jgi:hypothetical protein